MDGSTLEAVAIQLALALGVAFAGGVAAMLLRLPLQLGYLTGGIALGIALPRAEGPAILSVAADLAVAGLLFILAQQVPLRYLAERPIRALLASVQFIGVALAAAWLAASLGVDPRAGFVIGAALAPSSTAFATEVLAQRRSRPPRAFTLTSSLAQGAIALACVAVGFAPGASSWFDTGVRAVLALVLLPAGVMAGLAVLRFALSRIGDAEDDVAQLAVVGIVLLTVAVPAVQLGLPLAIVALIAGCLVAGDDRARAALRRTHDLREVFVALFLVGLGSMLDPAILVDNAGVAMALAGVVIAVKFVSSAASARGAGLPLAQALLAGAALAPFGEVAFVVGQEGLARGVLDREQHQLILGAIATGLAGVSIAIPAVAGAGPRRAPARSMTG
jgi:CPA2 family monovalent cation:H+ antiporter-2